MYPTRQQARLLQPGAVLQHHHSADPGAAGETLHASHQLYQQFQCSDVNSSTMKRVQVTHLSESSGVCGSPAVDLCAASRCPKHYCPWQEFTAAGWCWQLVEHRSDFLLFKRRPPVITGDQSGRGGRSTGVWSRRGSGEDDDGEEEEMIWILNGAFGLSSAAE